MVAVGRARVRSVRTRLREEMLVDTRTIGTDLTYPLVSLNISKSGLLLAWEGNARAPFQCQTLLDLQIDAAGLLFDSPLVCIGKVVRKVDKLGLQDPVKEEREPEKYGIQIVQIDPAEQQIWESKIVELEQQFPQNVDRFDGEAQNHRVFGKMLRRNQ